MNSEEKIFEVEINLQEGKRIGKRKRDDAYKDEIEKKKWLPKNCHEVFKTIAPSVNKEGLENLLTKDKFGDIECQQDHLVESPDLKSRFHLRALAYLEEKGVFKGAASPQVDCLLKSFDRSERESGVSKQGHKSKVISKAKGQKTMFESLKKTS